jgi:hypothetical protein
MPKNTHKQYTLRNIPIEVDRILRLRAKQTAKSFNQVAVEALALGAGKISIPKRDLSFMVGSMTEIEAKKMDTAISEQKKIDRKLWK